MSVELLLGGNRDPDAVYCHTCGRDHQRREHGVPCGIPGCRSITFNPCRLICPRCEFGDPDRDGEAQTDREFFAAEDDDEFAAWMDRA